MMLSNVSSSGLDEIQEWETKRIYWWAVEAYKFFKKINPDG